MSCRQNKKPEKVITKELDFYQFKIFLQIDLPNYKFKKFQVLSHMKKLLISKDFTYQYFTHHKNYLIACFLKMISK
jgi:hypothetical protein